MKLTLTIRKATPSLNRQLRKHWAKRHASNRDWFFLVKAALGDIRYFDRPNWRKSKIHVERHFYAHPIKDDDNLWASAKPILDALQVAGIIFNDSREHIDLSFTQVKVRYASEQKSVITIEPIEA